MEYCKPLILDGAFTEKHLQLLQWAKKQKKLLGICTVAGEVPVSLATKIALHAGVRVYVGCPRPLVRTLSQKPSGVIPYNIDKDTESTHCVEFLINTFQNTESKIVYIAVGPLTNLALALRICPEISAKCEKVILISGPPSGNQNFRCAEDILRLDPEAAQIVLSSGIHIDLVKISQEYISIIENCINDSEFAGYTFEANICLDQGNGAGAVLRNYNVDFEGNFTVYNT